MNFASREDILQASKAVFDQTRSYFHKDLGQIEESLLQKIPRMLEARIEQLFRTEVQKLLGEFLQAQEEKMLKMQETYEASFEQVKAVLQLVVTPQITVNVPERTQPIYVNVPEQAINVVHPDVHVNVPQQAPPTVSVQVPEQPAPVVNVQVPESRVPDVHVNVPHPRLLKKHIQYDEYGRPAHIEEVEAGDNS